MEGVAVEKYPSIIALAPYLAEANRDEQFQFGVEILKKGLEKRLADDGERKSQ